MKNWRDDLKEREWKRVSKLFKVIALANKLKVEVFNDYSQLITINSKVRSINSHDNLERKVFDQYLDEFDEYFYKLTSIVEKIVNQDGYVLRNEMKDCSYETKCLMRMLETISEKIECFVNSDKETYDIHRHFTLEDIHFYVRNSIDHLNLFLQNALDHLNGILELNYDHDDEFIHYDSNLNFYNEFLKYDKTLLKRIEKFVDQFCEDGKEKKFVDKFCEDGKEKKL